MSKKVKNLWKMYLNCPNSILVSLLFVALIGCYKKDKGYEIMREVCENTCKSVLNDNQCSQKSKQIAKQVLDGWSDKILDPKPYLIHVAYDKKNGSYLLYLTMSDEEEDIVGVLVQETENNTILFQENYPFFARQPAGSFRWIPFEERTLDRTKDIINWNEYQSQPNVKPRPLVYISIPEKDKIQVNIAVYDKKGNQSEFMPLESTYYRRRENQRGSDTDIESK